MNHAIKVSLVDDPADPSRKLVFADPNPLPARGPEPPPPRTVVSRGDTVTWLFDPATLGGRTLEVVFVAARDLPAGVSQPLTLPFSLGPAAGQVVGTIHPSVPAPLAPAKRFFYQILEAGTALPWKNPVDGKPIGASDGGGIDIPRTPP